MQGALIKVKIASPGKKQPERLPTIDRQLNDKPSEQFLKYVRELGVKKLERK